MPAHKVGHRDADAEGPGNPLKHDKGSMAAPVKVPDKTEEEGYQQGVDGVCSEIVCGGQDDFPVFGKKTCKQIPVKEREIGQNQAAAKGYRHAVDHSPFGPVHLSGSEVLGYKGGHGLAEGGGHHQDEGTQLFGHPHSGGSDDAQAVDDGKDDQEGYAD